jgi:hypothetical protein
LEDAMTTAINLPVMNLVLFFDIAHLCDFNGMALTPLLKPILFLGNIGNAVLKNFDGGILEKTAVAALSIFRDHFGLAQVLPEQLRVIVRLLDFPRLKP